MTEPTRPPTDAQRNPMPQRHSPRRPLGTDTRWLIGGLGAVVVVVAVALAIVVSTRSDSGGAGTATPVASTGSADRNYRKSENICRSVDTSRIPAELRIAQLEDRLKTRPTEGICQNAGEGQAISRSFLGLYFTISNTAAEAAGPYQHALGVLFGDKRSERLEGPWDEAVIEVGDTERPGVVVRDKNLSFSFSILAPMMVAISKEDARRGAIELAKAFLAAAASEAAR
ncbi:hypothetical protein [Nocardia sp. NPDC050435]|uniref:hypothetical protein n=1 Tax=Nocardia sp. NPDC050435 TaxID=3155040 RepID=UPI0033E2728A